MENSNLDDLTNYLSLVNPSVKKNLSIISNKDVDQDYLLRLDTVMPRSAIKTMSPMIPFSASMDVKLEDRTLPRISGSLNILDCLLGMSRLHSDFMKANNKICYISAIDFELAVKPNSKLLYDVDLTNEYWLIPYNKSTYKYVLNVIGSLFPISVTKTFNKTNNGKPLVLIECYMHVDTDMGISIDGKDKVKNGYYSLTYEKDNNSPSQIVKIKQKDYEEKMSLTANNYAIEVINDSLISNW